MKLKEKYIVDCTLEVKTGLHIGSGKDDFEIGGLDNPIIKYRSIDGIEYPYIPGSSLKGKLRSLLEMVDSNSNINDGKACSCGNCSACKLFGFSNNNNKGPARVIVRDSFLSKEFKDKEYLTEEKSENSIDRITGTGLNPRYQERIVPGVKFDVQFVINVYDGDKKNYIINDLKKAIELLNNDYLGGSGSRGYGRVEIVMLDKEKKIFSMEDNKVNEK